MKKLRNYWILLLVSLLLFGVSFSEILDNTDDIDTIYEFFPGPPRFHFEVRNIYERFSLIVLILSIITLLKFVCKGKNNNSKNINADNLKLKKRYILLIIFAFVSLLWLLGL